LNTQTGVFSNLYQKIIDKSSQNIYSDEEVQKELPKKASKSNLKDGEKLSRTKMFSARRFSNKMSDQTINAHNKSLSRSEFFKEKSFLEKQDDLHYRYNKTDSKFFEIIDLKNRNETLLKENKQLKNDLVEIDEFEEVLRKKTKIEDFNEKRCDILKACVRKQKRYIDYMNKTFRMTKIFYKDLQHVLEFLKELEDKYFNSKFQFNKDELKSIESISSQVDMAARGLSEIYKQLGNTTTIKNYLTNFNEAYNQLKNMDEKNMEIEELFNFVSDKSKPDGTQTVKYNYALKKFINQYKNLFPIYTVFNEFELKDKIHFSTFLEQITLISEKISNVFGRIKNFDLLRNANFISQANIPELLKQNKVTFKEYFDEKNPNKRIHLDGEAVHKVEKSLAFLLNNLIKFHNSLILKKEEICVDDILELQETLRVNIENLLLLGINTTFDFSWNDKVIVVSSTNQEKNQQNYFKENSFPEKNFLFESYAKEFDNIDKFQALKNDIQNLFDESVKNSQTTSEDFNSTMETMKVQIEKLQIYTHDIGLISRLKDIEIKFLREYSHVVINNVEKLKTFVDEKTCLLDSFIKDLNTQLKELDRWFEITWQNPKDFKNRLQFQRRFKKFYQEVGEKISMILTKQKNSMYLGDLQNTLELGIAEIKRELQRNSKRFQEIDIRINKAH